MRSVTKIILLSLTGIFLAFPSVAQLSKLQIGRDYFVNGDYRKALEYFNQAIDQDKSVSWDLLSEACYLRGVTYIRLYNQAFTGSDPAQKKLYRDALLSAYRDFKSSIEHDEGPLLDEIDQELKNLHHPLLQEGLASLNDYNTTVYNGKPDERQLKRAEDYIVAAHEIRENYLVCDLLGQVYLNKGMKTEAAGYFSKSEQEYSENLPEMPDFMMAYVFYRLAAIHKETDISLAIDDYRRGNKLMESEYIRFQPMKAALGRDRSNEMEDQYRLAMNDLHNLKLDLFAARTDHLSEALLVFEDELAENPGDVKIMTGYASLLEKIDPDKAIEEYEKILDLDSLNAIALFNLGALNYDKGKKLFESAQQSDEKKLAKEWENDATTYFISAQHFFEKSLSVEPGSAETINALKTIAFVLDDKKAYKFYEEMEKNH